MSSLTQQSFVLFPLGKKRFALPAETVTELARPDELQTFPHRTPLIAGVLLRRGRIVTVCDVAQVLIGNDAPAGKFYLIASRTLDSRPEWTAIPVTGECELLSESPVPPAQGHPAYITGLLSLPGEIVEILDLDTLSSAEVDA